MVFIITRERERECVRVCGCEWVYMCEGVNITGRAFFSVFLYDDIYV